MDDASFRNKTTTTKERRKDGSYLREFLDGVSRGVPRVPRHERVARESSPNVLARSNASSRASESDRRRGVPPFLHQRRLFCVWLNGWWWWCLSSFLPFFTTFFKTHEEKQTNKQIANERRKKQTHQSFENPYEILTRRILVCVTNNI